MTPAGWKAVRTSRPLVVPPWLEALEPLTTGLLAQENLKLWTFGEAAAIGIRAGGVVYPVFPQPVPKEQEAGARSIFDRVGEAWCLMGPAAWVERAERLMPPSKIQHRVDYDFLVRPAAGFDVPPALDCRLVVDTEAEQVFPLQEAYEKEEVLFDPQEFQPLVSRLNWAHLLKRQEVVALWEGGRPSATARTNALTRLWGQIGGVYTLPTRRGQGLQKRTMGYLLNRLTAQGRGACLFVKKSNPRALGLYLGLGFRPVTDFTITYGERRVWGPGFL